MLCAKILWSQCKELPTDKSLHNTKIHPTILCGYKHPKKSKLGNDITSSNGNSMACSTTKMKLRDMSICIVHVKLRYVHSWKEMHICAVLDCSSPGTFIDTNLAKKLDWWYENCYQNQNLEWGKYSKVWSNKWIEGMKINWKTSLDWFSSNVLLKHLASRTWTFWNTKQNQGVEILGKDCWWD